MAAEIVLQLRRELPRFSSDRRGNIAMIFALASIPILFAVGMAIDYTSAARRRAKLDAIADAAALSAVTPTEFSQTPGQGPNASQAQTAAQTLFNTLASAVSGLSNIQGNVSVTDSPSGKTNTRVATVVYTAQSQNAFGGIIGLTSLPIGNGSGITAQAQAAPNINFYILADSSPSMAIPATTAGIDQMYLATYCSAHLVSDPTSTTTKNNCPTSTYTAGGAYTSTSTSGSTTTMTITSGQATQTNYGDNEVNVSTSGGCSFACHESDETKWVLPGNTNFPGTGSATSPGFVDDYTYAENILGLTLRIDNLRSAISQLGPYAYNVSQVGVNGAPANSAAYQMAVATFDTDWTGSACSGGHSPLHYITGNSSALSLVNASTSAGGQTISTDAQNIQMLQVFNNGFLTGTSTATTTKKNNKTTTTISSTTGCNNDDGDTALNAALQGISSLMATPGNGTNTTGDTPQEVLILITDGVNDSYSPRSVSMLDASNCTAIKNKVSSSGLPIRIAVLYLDYSDLKTSVNQLNFDNSFYESNVEPFDDNTSPTPNPNIATQLQSCASSPSLYQTVSTDQDIGTALKALFLNATATAHLSH